MISSKDKTEKRLQRIQKALNGEGIFWESQEMRWLLSIVRDLQEQVRVKINEIGAMHKAWQEDYSRDQAELRLARAVVEALNISKNLEHALYCEGYAYDHLAERWRTLSSQLTEARKALDVAFDAYRSHIPTPTGRTLSVGG